MSTANLSYRCVVLFRYKVLGGKTVSLSADKPEIEFDPDGSANDIRERYKDGVVTEAGPSEVRIFDGSVADRSQSSDPRG